MTGVATVPVVASLVSGASAANVSRGIVIATGVSTARARISRASPRAMAQLRLLLPTARCSLWRTVSQLPQGTRRSRVTSTGIVIIVTGIASPAAISVPSMAVGVRVIVGIAAIVASGSIVTGAVESVLRSSSARGPRRARDPIRIRRSQR